MKLALVLIASMFAVTAQAFPPAPYYTLYGMVRDQVGQTLDVVGAEIVLYKGTTEIGRGPITRGLQLDQNYELSIRLDMMRTGTAAYTSTAVQSQGLFSIVVQMNGVNYYPIEASGSLKAGKGGERVRLDLNLGDDTDHDGLPDIWEEWQLYLAGYYPDENGNWPLNLLSKNGNFFKNGLTDWQNYLVGTFADDPHLSFDLEIKEKTDTNVRFEFYAITGKTYTIEHSTDLKVWSRINFGVDSAASADAFKSANAGIKSAFAAPTAGRAKEFYRLTVR